MPEVICDFNYVRISIPKGLFRKCFKRIMIKRKDMLKIGRKKREIDNAITKLQHCLSIVEKIQNREVEI